MEDASQRRITMEVLFSDEYAKKLENLAKARAEEAAEAALNEFPQPKQLTWTEFDRPTERKLAFDVVEKLPSSIRTVLYFLNSRPMLNFLEILTGIKGVIPDPYYVGGGLHQIKPGGNLEVHADFNNHTTLKLD